MDPRQFDYIRSDIIITKLFDMLKANNEMYVEDEPVVEKAPAKKTTSTAKKTTSTAKTSTAKKTTTTTKKTATKKTEE